MDVICPVTEEVEEMSESQISNYLFVPVDINFIQCKLVMLTEMVPQHMIHKYAYLGKDHTRNKHVIILKNSQEQSIYAHVFHW